MPAIKEVTHTTFNKILVEIERFQESRQVAWYRGVGNAAYSLIPTLSRNNPPKSAQQLWEFEKKISNTFIQRSPPFVNVDFSNEWRILFYMQHYGIPTRLLDWSESPFVALYFALSSVKRNDNGEPMQDAALWACDPIAWNRTALSHISFQGGILDESCEEIKSYSPSADIDQRSTIPIMIYGTHNSPRIVAQRGVFALFGKGTSSMQDVYNKEKFATGSLLKINIPAAIVNNILASLYKKGIAESTIYPDIFGLSLEIKRKFGYY